MADRPVNDAPYGLIADVEFGTDVVVHAFANLYGCRIGDETQVGTFVEIQRDAVVGARCKIQSHTFVCDGVGGLTMGAGARVAGAVVTRAVAPGEVVAGVPARAQFKSHVPSS